MESLSHILEEELAGAFEVKDRQSLHRYTVLLSENIVQKREHELAVQNASSDIRMVAQKMESGFAVMDERFASMDRRFEDMNRHFDEVNRRFEDTNKRFDEVNQRFEDTNKRFEDANKRFDDFNRRFDDVNKRFSQVQWLIGIGLALITGLMSLYQIL